LLTASQMKAEKYSSPEGRGLYARRERLAKAAIELMGIAVEPVGNGTMASDIFEGWHASGEDRFDFYAPAADLYFEVTGTDWTERRSAARFDRSVLAVLKKKVDDACAYGLEGRLWFVSIAEMEGEWRFLPCLKAREYPLVDYARGEKAYYGIPWKDWWKPCRAQAHFLRAAAKGGRR